MKSLILLTILVLIGGCLNSNKSKKSLAKEYVTSASDLLAISPTGRQVVVSSAGNFKYKFSGSSGNAPYTYSMATSIGGTIDSNGDYTPPNVTGTEIVRVTDAVGNFVNATVIINNPVGIYPSNLTRVVAYGGSIGITSSGGVPPYTYSLMSGGGFLQTFGQLNTTYFAPTVVSNDSTAILRVTDTLGMFSETTIHLIQPQAMAITPLTRVITTGNSSNISNGSVTFSYAASGGYPPYTYSILSGPGTINSKTGIYTRPNDSSIDSRTAIIRVTDAEGETRDAVAYLQPVLRANPSTASVAAGKQIRIDGIGGTCPYAFTKMSGNGTLTSIPATNLNYAQGSVVCNAALFVAPLSAGTSVVRLIDANNHFFDVTVTTTGSAISSDESNFSISPVTRIVANNSTSTESLPVSFPYVMTGGLPPYSLALVSGPGSVETYNYVPPSDSSNVLRTAVVRATDFLGVTRKATVFIQPKLNVFTTPIQPTNPWALGSIFTHPEISLPSTTANRTMAIGAQVRIDGGGGVCPFTYSLASGLGTLGNYTFTTNNFSQLNTTCGLGIYSAPNVAETSQIMVTDAQGNSEFSTITVVDDSLGAREWSFGVGGTQTISFGAGDDYLKDIAKDSLDNLYLAGYTYNSLTSSYDFAIAKLNAAGVLDMTFGTGGLVKTDLSSNKNDYATSIAIQSDGKVVVAGYCDKGTTGYDFCAIRLNTNGTLDTGFNTTGIWSGLIQAGLKSEYITSMTIDSTGKIILVGQCNSANATNLFDICVARLTTSGVLDVTFNTTGILVNSLAGQDFVGSVAVAGDNSIYVGASCSTVFCIYKYGPTGVLDSSFGYSNGFSRIVAGANLVLTNSTPVLMALQSDGKIVFAGAAAGASSDYLYAVGRLNSDGTLDDFFGTEGRFLIGQSFYNTGTATGSLSDYVNNLIIQPDGKILTLGKTYNNNSGFDISAMRLISDGSLDLRFGSAGRLAYTTASNAYTEGGVQLSDESVIVGGGMIVNGKSKFTLIKINP